MNELFKGAANNRARVEVWEDGQFLRQCVELDRADSAAHYLTVDCRAKKVAIVLQWRLPVTVRSLVVGFAVFKSQVYQPARDGTALECWDGTRWRRIRARLVVDASRASRDACYRRFGTMRWVYRFPATTTRQLRFQINTQARRADRRHACIIRDLACYDGVAAARAGGEAASNIRFVGKPLRRRFSAEELRKIDLGGADLLGRRILASRGGATYASVAAPLYPMDFYKSAIGRIDEGSKTLVTWNGTLIMVEGVAAADWNHYSEKSMAAGWAASARMGQLPLVMEGFDAWVDRWFAFAAGAPGELVGTDLNRTAQGWIEGYLPGIRTVYRQGALTYTFTAFVAAGPRMPYLNRVQVEVENHGARAIDGAVGVIMGRHPSEAMHETSHTGSSGPGRDPLFFAPHPTGYALDAAGRTVSGPKGEVILRSSRRGRFGGTDWERVFTVPLKVAPGRKQVLHLLMPGVAKPLRRAPSVTDAAARRQLSDFRAFWERTLAGKVRIETPESRLNVFHRNAIAQILIGLLNRGKLKYGSYWYEEYYGPEEAEAVIALAKCGYGREAKRALEIMLSAELLDPGGYHHQYRNGVAAQAVAEVYALDGDTAWLARVAPRLASIGEWIIGATGAESSRYAGLLPKRTYGGDISTPARSISTNTRCWRGLRDAGVLMRALGRHRQADRFLEHAARYRQRIMRLIHAVVDRSHRLPFLPMGLDIGQPGSADYRAAEPAYRSLSQEKMGAYWHIFAVWILRSGILDAGGPEARWITDYIERRGGLLLGLLRLGKHYTAAHVDIDPHYGLGYIQTLLARGEREKFLLSFYGLLAHGMSRNTFSSPESSCVFPLRVDPAAWNRMFADTRWEWGANYNYGLTEPLSSGASTAALSLLRDMLVREDTEGSKTILHLFSGVPSAWLAPGKSITLQGAPTRYGVIGIRSGVAEDGAVRIRIDARWRTRPDEVRLHLHPPARARARIAGIWVNGKPWASASSLDSGPGLAAPFLLRPSRACPDKSAGRNHNVFVLHPAAS